MRTAPLARCRALKIEPPGRVERIVGAGRARFEREFCLHVLNGLSADSARSLWELATGEDGFLLELKSDPGRLGLETLLEEIVKLRRAKALGLSADLFGGYSDRLVASWRARAMASHPSDFAANQPPVRLTLVAALAWSRTTEITDALVDLFIGLVSKINTRAERKVEKAIEAEAKKVHRKTEKLFSIAEASLRAPEGTVRQVVFLAVPGGEATLQALVTEAKADARAYKARARTVVTSSYTSYYRRMPPKLLAASGAGTAWSAWGSVPRQRQLGKQSDSQPARANAVDQARTPRPSRRRFGRQHCVQWSRQGRPHPFHHRSRESPRWEDPGLLPGSTLDRSPPSAG